MNETMKMLQALGLYVICAKEGAKSKAECIAAQDYHDFLSPYVAKAEAVKGMFNFNEGNPLKPLSDITLTINEYSNVVSQIYDQGIMQLNALNLPYPVVAAPEVPHEATTYFGNYLKTLGNDPRTPEDVESIIGRINELMMHKTGASPRVTGLVVGRVQSGKTRNYVGLALKAIAEGWNTIIVLTSCSTALADQTEERILEDFEKKAGLVPGPDFGCLKFRGSVPSEPAALGKKGYVYVGVAMKQRDNLDHILEWLEKYPDRVLHMRLLLIDDEADNATPDSNCGKENKLDDDAIDALVDATADEENGDGGAFILLSNWISEVRNSPRLTDDETSPWKPMTEALSKTLEHSNQRTFDTVLSNEDFQELLGLDENQAVLQQIRDYFKGNGTRSPGYFLKLLNTLLDVGVARSAINGRICRLIALSQTGEYNFKFAKFAYVAYTATPYANILNERSDQTPLYPDFIKSLQEAPQYFGFDKIFGEDVNESRPKMNIVNVIPRCEDGKTTHDEVRYILRPIQKCYDCEKPNHVLAIQGPDNELNVSCAEKHWVGRWNTLREAVTWLYCSAGARRWHRREILSPGLKTNQALSADEKAKKLNALEARWTTMLMNISQVRDVHQTSKTLIDRLLAHCCSSANEASFMASCERCWGEITQRFTKTDFDALFNSGNPGENYSAAGRPIQDYPQWNEIADDVLYFVRGTVGPQEKDRKVHTVVVNSENRESRENQDFYFQRFKSYKRPWINEHRLDDDQAWIMCGGNTISRGLTLPGLTASYFDRVRKSATIDTLTQMGRWFGFRMGYELYPRIWMTQETVTEMKRICVTENRMHETMRENFDAGYSPSDPAHYQQVYYWGRRLSGRQRQLHLSGAPIGTTGITDDISTQQCDIAANYAAAKKFVESLGRASSRSQVDYLYYRNPTWSDVPANDVINFLNQVSGHYPENSKRKIESLAKELRTSGVKHVDVVIGEPSSASQRGGKTYALAANIPAHNGIPETGKVKSGFPQNPKVNGSVIKYNSLRTHTAFFSMLKREALNMADLECLKDEKRLVVAQLRDNAVANGGLLSAQFENAFNAVGLNNGSIEQRLEGYVRHLENNPRLEMATCIHELLSAGLRTRASMEYCERAFDKAKQEKPVVQLYFVNPPDGIQQEEPYVSISFYWPKHQPCAYQMGTVEAPPPVGHPDEREIYGAIGGILRDNDFPMTCKKLKVALMQRYPLEPESIYYQNVVDGQTHSGYRRLDGKDAYYSLRWCGDDKPEDKINSEVRTVALGIIRRQRRNFRSQEIVDAVMRENPRFDGIVTLTTTMLNQQILTDEVLAANNISKVSANPVLYRMN